MNRRSFAKTWPRVAATFAVLITAAAWWHAHVVKRALASADLEREALAGRVAAARATSARSREQLAAVDAENQRLIEAIADGAIPSASASAKPQLTRAAILARYQRAQALERSGDAAAALEEYRWCYDVGFRVHDFIARLARFAAGHPPAAELLRERRVQAEQRVLADPDDIETMSDVIALNKALDDHPRTLAIFDRLPDGEIRRQHSQRSMLEVFLATQRYADAARVLPYAQLKEGLDRAMTMDRQREVREKAQAAVLAAEGLDETQRQAQLLAIARAREAQRRAVIAESAVGLEILAGSGEVEQARDLATRVLAFDGSEATRALLREHARRAGHPELFPDAPP